MTDREEGARLVREGRNLLSEGGLLPHSVIGKMVDWIEAATATPSMPAQDEGLETTAVWSELSTILEFLKRIQAWEDPTDERDGSNWRVYQRGIEAIDKLLSRRAPAVEGKGEPVAPLVAEARKVVASYGRYEEWPDALGLRNLIRRLADAVATPPADRDAMIEECAKVAHAVLVGADLPRIKRTQFAFNDVPAAIRALKSNPVEAGEAKS